MKHLLVLIVLSLGTINALAKTNLQINQIAGVVTDKSGTPLAKVRVIVSGIGYSETDDYGQFVIKVNESLPQDTAINLTVIKRGWLVVNTNILQTRLSVSSSSLRIVMRSDTETFKSTTVTKKIPGPARPPVRGRVVTKNSRETVASGMSLRISEAGRFPKLSIKVTNPTDKNLTLKQVILRVERWWQIRHLIQPVFLKSASNYDVMLPIVDPPYSVQKELSQSIKPGENAELSLTLSNDELTAGEMDYIFLAKAEIVYGDNPDDNRSISNEQPLFLILQGGRIGSSRILVSMNESEAPAVLNADKQAVKEINSINGFKSKLLNDLILNITAMSTETFAGNEQLIEAINKNHLNTVKALVAAGVNVNEEDRFAATPLIQAAQKGYFDIINVLISAGAHIDQPNQKGMTPLMVVADKGLTESVQTLIKLHADLNLTNTREYNKTALIYAVEKNHMDIVKALIAAGADVNINSYDYDRKNSESSDLRKYEPKPALIYAVEKGSVDIVKTLIVAGADVNSGLKGFNYTPLGAAIANGNLDSMRSLINAGAKLNSFDDMTAVRGLVIKNQLEIVKLLTSANTPWDAYSYEDDPVLVIAADHNYIDMIKLLIATGANVDISDGKSLRVAISNGHVEAVKALIAAGANVNIDKPYIKNPLETAVSEGNIETIKVLLNAGAKVSKQVLNYAKQRGDVKIIEAIQAAMSK